MVASADPGTSVSTGALSRNVTGPSLGQASVAQNGRNQQVKRCEMTGFGTHFVIPGPIPNMINWEFSERFFWIIYWAPKSFWTPAGSTRLHQPGLSLKITTKIFVDAFGPSHLQADNTLDSWCLAPRYSKIQVGCILKRRSPSSPSLPLSRYRQLPGGCLWLVSYHLSTFMSKICQSSSFDPKRPHVHSFIPFSIIIPPKFYLLDNQTPADRKRPVIHGGLPGSNHF